MQKQIDSGQANLENLLVMGDEVNWRSHPQLHLCADQRAENLFEWQSEGEGAILMLDNFLAHLASVISRSISHLFTPATPLFSAYFTPRITFHLFIVSNHKVLSSILQHDILRNVLCKC